VTILLETEGETWEELTEGPLRLSCTEVGEGRIDLRGIALMVDRALKALSRSKTHLLTLYGSHDPYIPGSSYLLVGLSSG